MRKTSSSAKCSWICAFSSRADARSCPNGFSMISRDPALARRGARRSPRRASRSRAAARRSSRRGCPACRAPRRARVSTLASSSSPLSSAKSSVDVAHAARELVPASSSNGRARAPCTASFIRSRNCVVGLLGARGADDREALRQQPPHGERVERRHQLLRGQVAGRAEDDERCTGPGGGAAAAPRASGLCSSVAAIRRGDPGSRPSPARRPGPRGRRTGCAARR